MLRKRAYNTFDSAVQAIHDLLVTKGLTRPQGGPRLLFLCGGNKADDTPSERRKALTSFIHEHHPDINVVYAEDVNRELLVQEDANNLFELENNLSWIVDYVVIILEGYGSFCELGAFSHDPLRNKLIIINDKTYSGVPSFINHGPLAAIRGRSDNWRILEYFMAPDGCDWGDAIGDIFSQLNCALDNLKKGSRAPLGIPEVKPSGVPNKEKLLFVHDLIYFCGPISNRRFVSLLTKLFGKEDYKLHKQLYSILMALNLVTREEKRNVYLSTRKKPFLGYRGQEMELAISFKMYELRQTLRR